MEPVADHMPIQSKSGTRVMFYILYPSDRKHLAGWDLGKEAFDNSLAAVHLNWRERRGNLGRAENKTRLREKVS